MTLIGPSHKKTREVNRVIQSSKQTTNVALGSDQLTPHPSSYIIYIQYHLYHNCIVAQFHLYKGKS